MRQRLLQHQPDAAIALDVLCPEIGDARFVPTPTTSVGPPFLPATLPQ